MQSNNGKLRIGDLTLDRHTHEVRRGGEVIDLPGLSYRLFDTLARHWPDAVTRRRLVQEVWGGTIVSDNTVRQRVRLLRNALGRPGYVKSVKGLGYRLNSAETAGSSSRLPARLGWKAIVWGAVIAIIVAFMAYPAPAWLHALKHLLKHAS